MSKIKLNIRKLVLKGSVLSPVDRISEVLYGLIMTLTFTGAIRLSGNGDEKATHDLLFAALGCNFAWGLVDAVMYLMSLLTERGHAHTLVQKIIRAKQHQHSRELLRGEISPLIAALLDEKELDNMANRLKSQLPPSSGFLITWSDVKRAGQIFLLVFLCTFPVAFPFAVVHDVQWAIMLSNGIAFTMLFLGGFALAKYAGFWPWTTALLFTLFGICLVAITVLLGG